MHESRTGETLDRKMGMATLIITAIGPLVSFKRSSIYLEMPISQRSTGHEGQKRVFENAAIQGGRFTTGTKQPWILKCWHTLMRSEQ